MTSPESELPAPRSEVPGGLRHCGARWALFVFGWICVGMGFIGVFVPGLPTTVFLIVAFWAFSKSSDRFHLWLWNHPRFGKSLRDWHQHRVISRRAKFLAVSMMGLSFTYLAIFVAENWMLPLSMAAMMGPAALYVVTRDSEKAERAAVPVRAERQGDNG